MNGFINLLGRQTTATHPHTVPVQNLADRPPLDTKPRTQLIYRLPTLISGDQFPDLISAELPGPAGFGSGDGRRGGCGGVGKLPAQRFQGFYLRFRVIVSSPKVHRTAKPQVNGL
ncbi:hypothetical protein [Nocardia jiangxiensis]|uniref:hypothetical protein n=1 Tax=Nocardia jiangxiensis TaxID=282685 RepID=UPI0012F673BA|nr:hypothetical protein [Nocardia jiangxiensis]